MSKESLILYFDEPSIYREAVYNKIEEKYDCQWYFDKADKGVGRFDPSKYKSVSFLPIKRVGPFYFVKGLVSLLRKDSERYLMIGATANMSLFFLLMAKCLFFRKKNVYLWTHGFYGKEGWLNKTLWKRPMLKMADGIFTYGDYAKKIMVEDGFNPDKIFPIHNSLDYDKQLELRKSIQPSSIYKDHFGNEHPTLIFIGRLTKVKKLDMLVDALSKLRQKGKRYNLVFVGDGTVRENLELRVESLELREQVWFYGACYDEKANAELIYNADLCVAPGNIGLTSIHSLMFGCPAVSHNDFKYQMPEFEVIKSGITGDFFIKDDVESLAKTIEHWFETMRDKRDVVRKSCYEEIDERWNPHYQMNVLSKYLK